MKIKNETMKFKLLLCAVVISTAILAQKEGQCEVTMQSGAEITGHIKNYNPFYDLSGSFSLHKNDKKIRLYAKNITKVVVDDTIIYKILTNRKGFKILMRPLVEGKPFSLYLHSSRRSGNLPGQGFTTWTYNEFYIMDENGKTEFMNERKVHKKPENYFPGAPRLQETIKATKKEDIDLEAWVTQYNKLMSHDSTKDLN